MTRAAKLVDDPPHKAETAGERFALTDKYLREEGTVYLTGIQALVRLLLDRARADRRRGLSTACFVSGYQGSPLAGFDMELLRQKALLSGHEIVFQPGLNEELAATAVGGSQRTTLLPGPRFSGVAGMWYGKAPGLDRASDALRHANFWGTDPLGGVLAIAGDDPTAKSSTMPSDSQAVLHDLGMPILYPSDVQDILDLGLAGYELSRGSGLWVGMKMVTEVADGSGTASVSPDRIRTVQPGSRIEGPRDRRATAFLGPQLLEIERGLYDERLEFARAFGRINGLNVQSGTNGDAWLGIVAAGRTYAELRQALLDLGLTGDDLRRRGIRLLKLGMVFPLDRDTIFEFASGLEELLVLEEKRPFIEAQIADLLYNSAAHPVLVGKSDERGLPLVRDYSELVADDIARIVARRLKRKIDLPSVSARVAYLERGLEVLDLAAVLPKRTPYFCSGCPHNRSLVTPEGSLVGAGIGCHTMAVLGTRTDFGEIIGLTQMGGEGAQWVGIEPFTTAAHMFQNIGDGTFAHSGSLAVRFAVAAGSNVTFKILYNSAVAMTGGQDAVGGATVPDMCRSLLAERVVRIIVTTEEPARYRHRSLPRGVDVWHRDRLDEAQHTLAAVPGVTVLIHDQRCAAETRRLRKRGLLPEEKARIVINQRVCEGCGDCGEKSGCLSLHAVETEFGRKTQVHQSSCNSDFSCLLGDCPAFTTVVSRTEGAAAAIVPAPAVSLPEPVLKVPNDDFSAYMVGIGGTGVVTVNQLLAVAAMMEGKLVRALDQTGLSQKAGPVASHLRLASEAKGLASSAVNAGSADLLLGFDALGSAQAATLRRVDHRRTVAVISTSEMPTAANIGKPWEVPPPFGGLRRAIDAVTRGGENSYIDSQRIADELLGDSMAANIVLVGAAYQNGSIPLRAGSIEEAIRTNGVAVGMNLNAFRWGRIAVARPELLAAAFTAKAPPAAAAVAEPEALRIVDGLPRLPAGELRRLLESRTSELIRYQDAAYARRYAEFVEKVTGRESEQVPGHVELSETVARELYKLMAYKDEYEVARLHLEATGEAGQATSWYLHPPLLRAMGLKHKLRLGPWFRPAMVLLREMKLLRKTAFDPFGRTALRRAERQLVVDYCGLIEDLLELLTPENHAAAVRASGLVQMVRGYEGVKLASMERYEVALAAALEELELDASLRHPRGATTRLSRRG